MLSCQAATRLVSEGRERPLTLKERGFLRMHLLICKACGNFEKQVDVIGLAAKRYAKRKE